MVDTDNWYIEDRYNREVVIQSIDKSNTGQ